MEIPVKSWYEAAFLRHSQRKYSGEIPDDEVTTRIENVCNNFRPFKGTRAVLVRDSGKDVFKGAVSEFFYKVTETPYYITFIGDMNTPHVQEVTGYVGEAIILEATALGLNTCWVGGFYRPENVLKMIDLGQDERVLAITPIGYAKNETDRVGISNKQYRRKSIDRLVLSGEIESQEWVRTALDIARIAPSAANRQPWRFKIADDSVTVLTDSKRKEFRISRRLDCGIAMLHLELGSLFGGIRGKWEFLTHPEVARFRFK